MRIKRAGPLMQEGTQCALLQHISKEVCHNAVFTELLDRISTVVEDDAAQAKSAFIKRSVTDSPRRISY
eukprot:5336794-Pyramimonas_sp.AAC.2